jgi:prephenate dehydrogenase
MISSSEDPPFHHIAIVGLGLIGGSIALGVRERWPSIRILGIDHASVVAHAIGSGAIDRSATSIGDVGDCDLVVLAAPVGENARLLAELASVLTGTTIVTDVGGTKRDIVEVWRRHAPALTFIAGHPIGGAEKGGFGFARPDLFSARPWIFTPTDVAHGEPLARLTALVRGLGARPVTMEAARHDRLMAYVSHLPQLTASALMATVGDGAAADGLRVAGRGLVDTTRLASSPAQVWREICAANADELGHALDLLIVRLTALRADLAGGAVIEEVFADASHWRAELMKGRDG